MLYASTRNSLTKSLGSTHFTDSIFATSKADLTPSAYAAHRAHISAPKPLSSREQEMEDVRAAERLAGGTSYTGMQARRNHGAVGLAWPEDVEAAVKELGEGDGDRLLLLVNNPENWSLVISIDVCILSDHRSIHRDACPVLCGGHIRWRTLCYVTCLGAMFVLFNSVV